LLEIIFLILVSGYFIISASLVIGAKKIFPQLSEDQLPSISVIVAARNEKLNIFSCLDSLDNLIYPDDKIEIIIIDDASSDNTLKLSSDFIHGKFKFRVIHLDENDSTILRGKVRAMAEGIKIASGEIILTTDADCVVDPLWAKTIASYYVGNVGVVNGFTSQTTKNSFISAYGVSLKFV